MGKQEAVLGPGESISSSVNEELYSNSFARKLYDALSNGRQGTLRPSDYGTVEDHLVLSEMVKRGLLEPSHEFAPESLRFIVTGQGRREYERLVKEEYFKK